MRDPIIDIDQQNTRETRIFKNFLEGEYNIQGIKLKQGQDPNDAINWLKQNTHVAIVNPENDIPEGDNLIINFLLTSPEDLSKHLINPNNLLISRYRVSSDPNSNENTPIIMLSWQQLLYLSATGINVQQMRVLVVAKHRDIKPWQDDYYPSSELLKQYEDTLSAIIKRPERETIGHVTVQTLLKVILYLSRLKDITTKQIIQGVLFQILKEEINDWLADSTDFYQNIIEIPDKED